MESPIKTNTIQQLAIKHLTLMHEWQVFYNSTPFRNCTREDAEKAMHHYTTAYWLELLNEIMPYNLKPIGDDTNTTVRVNSPYATVVYDTMDGRKELSLNYQFELIFVREAQNGTV